MRSAWMPTSASSPSSMPGARAISRARTTSAMPSASGRATRDARWASLSVGRRRPTRLSLSVTAIISKEPAGSAYSCACFPERSPMANHADRGRGCAPPTITSAPRPPGTKGQASRTMYGNRRSDLGGGVGMRLVTFEVNGAQRLGAMVGERVIDLQAAGAALGAEGRGPGEAAIPVDVLRLLQLGEEGMDAVRALLDP